MARSRPIRKARFLLQCKRPQCLLRRGYASSELKARQSRVALAFIGILARQAAYFCLQTQYDVS
jgi:hypothetical protein